MAEPRTPSTSFVSTSTYNVTVPANPYLRCCVCGARVEYWLDAPGAPQNKPCRHHGDYESVCPSWGPVDGCQCQEHLGYVPHPAPTSPQTEYGKEQGPL